MTTSRCTSEEFWNNLLLNLTEIVLMQNSKPSFMVRLSWECQCGTWGPARTESQAKQAIVAHKEQRKEGCGDVKVTRLNAADR